MKHQAARFTRIFSFLGLPAIQSALDPAGQQAKQIDNLLILFFYVTLVVYLIVLLFLSIAIFRGRYRKPQDFPAPDLTPNPAQERKMQRVVVGAVGLTVVILFALLVKDSFTERSIYSLPDPKPVDIQITGHQWWWEVKYLIGGPSGIVTTANEIHVPVGKAVRFQLRSTDVIHSFWAPNFHGKKDLIPGDPTTVWFKADKTGMFRGQCAEYCGHQHAHMRFVIIAESKDHFEQWLNDQRKSSIQPVTQSQKHGQQVFLSSPCVVCHAIQGTNARATLGPDLTHLASRQMIAAGTIPNTRGHLGGWILDPQGIKPGVLMPQNVLSPQDLNDLLDYLQSLK